MRTFLLFLGIAGFAVLANGQTSTAQGASNGTIEYDLHGTVHLTMNRRK
jgi:hypothetical protein